MTPGRVSISNEHDWKRRQEDGNLDLNDEKNSSRKLMTIIMLNLVFGSTTRLYHTEQGLHCCTLDHHVCSLIYRPTEIDSTSL